jgi:RNA polymerase sigma-70 factor (ECF subfamily)
VPFETTHWSLVLAAGGDDSAAARRALESLCTTYWYPLYAFVRRSGRSAEDARDLTQAFFLSLLERRDFTGLRQERGRFRAFLLASARHFLANDIGRQRAAKRGGGVPHLSLETGEAEGRYQHEPADPATPETLFDRRWALTSIERVLGVLKREHEAAGRAREFDLLKASLLGEAPPGGYEAVAEALESTEGAVKTAIHRLRRRFQDELRRQIAETVEHEALVDDEIRYLIRAIS